MTILKSVSANSKWCLKSGLVSTNQFFSSLQLFFFLLFCMPANLWMTEIVTFALSALYFYISTNIIKLCSVIVKLRENRYF